MGYGICRIVKIKLSSGGELVGRLKHCAREFDDKKNSNFTSSDSKTAFQKYKENIKTVDKKRSDSVGSFEVVLTQSYDPKQSKKEKTNFVKESIMWAEKTFGAENNFGCFIHMDEKVPHIHLFYTPIKNKINKKNKKNEKVLCAKDWTGGKKKLSEMQDSFYNEVSKKFGLERGESAELNSRKNQRPTLKYDVELQKEREELNKLQKEINLNSDSINKLHEWRKRTPEDLEIIANAYRKNNCKNGYEYLELLEKEDTPELPKKHHSRGR